MQSILVPLRPSVLALLVAVLGGCVDSATAPAPATQPASAPVHASSSYGATLLECPIDVTRSTSAEIGLLGGSLELDGHSVLIPQGAVLVPTEFTLEIPASNYVEIDVRANGQDHFEFHEPVALTISYDRCTRSNIEKKTLRIYHVDSASKAILEDLGGTDDVVARAVTTSTDHLSDYAIGSPH